MLLHRVIDHAIVSIPGAYVTLYSITEPAASYSILH